MSLYWPIALIVISNTIYHICAKSTPEAVNPFASLTVTYAVAALCAAFAYFISNPGKNILQEYSQLNWTAFVFGISLLGLEVGSIYMYKVGWNINTGYILQSVFLAVALLIVGFFLYHEALTLNKVIGIVICMVGLYFLNK